MSLPRALAVAALALLAGCLFGGGTGCVTTYEYHGLRLDERHVVDLSVEDVDRVLRESGLADRFGLRGPDAVPGGRGVRWAALDPSGLHVAVHAAPADAGGARVQEVNLSVGLLRGTGTGPDPVRGATPQDGPAWAEEAIREERARDLARVEEAMEGVRAATAAAWGAPEASLLDVQARVEPCGIHGD